MHSRLVSPTKNRRFAAGFRADIQALRALAVVFVVVNHLLPAYLTGGFIGVDIFFVISGYLITAHLLKEIDAKGTVNLPSFYARRARRLLPAALFVTVTTLAAVLIFMPPSRWARTFFEGFASTAYFENWALYALASDYFTQTVDSTAFQHYWSLSVEEQFYLVWPLLLLGLVALTHAINKRIRILTTRTLLTLCITGIGAASFVFCLWLYTVNPSGAYFHTLGRVWEFALGGTVAIVSPQLSRAFTHPTTARTAMRTCIQFTGVTMIIAPAFLYTAKTPFPAPWALIPTIGTALVIAAGPVISTTLFRWITESYPVQMLGNISYSMYLWHLPLIIVLPYALETHIQDRYRVFILIATIVLAYLSWRYIEEPCRKGLFVKRKPRVTLSAALASVCVIGLASAPVAAISQSILHERQAQLAASTRSLNQNVRCVGAWALADFDTCGKEKVFADPMLLDYTKEDFRLTMPTLCKADNDNRAEMRAIICDYSAGEANAPTMWILGDSHAEMMQHAFHGIAKAHKWKLMIHEHNACMPIYIPGHSVNNTCTQWAADLSQQLAQNAPDFLFIAGSTWAQNSSSSVSGVTDAMIRNALEAEIKIWEQQGTQIVIMHDTPTTTEATRRACVETAANVESCAAAENEVVGNDRIYNAASQIASAHPSLTLLNLNDTLCRDDICYGSVGGVPAYYDNDHLTRSFTTSLQPVIEDRLSNAMKAAGLL